MSRIAIALAVGLIVAGCGTQPMTPSALHLNAPPVVNGAIPEPVKHNANLSAPKPAAVAETYSVSVYKVPAQSLLFALARDAKVNIDIHPGISGEVTLNAINQTLPNLLNRISKQIDMRYELDGANLSVMPDTPFIRNYKIDYVNIIRHTTGLVNIATEISSAGGTVAGGGTANNNSTTAVKNESNNDFWPTLVKNITDILRESDKILPGAAQTGLTAPTDTATPATTPTATPVAAPAVTPVTPAAPVAANTPNSNKTTTYRESGSVSANPENGILSVRATSRQHERIQEFLDMVMSSAKRQVLIEATVVEVQLSDQYQQGINWSVLNKGNASSTNIVQGQVNSVPLLSGVSPGTSAGLFSLNYANPLNALENLSVSIQLLESFGKVKVVSSPKISVLNNQTALLKVVDNNVYFTITATTTPGSLGVQATTTYTSTLNTVPVGFVMSVTPQITDTDEVTMNVRPTISRIIAYVQDPNPALSLAVPPVISNVPVIQSREMESILKVSSGQIAVMGGLMQDGVNNTKDAVPGANTLPIIGNLFNYRNENTTKSELVIFLRPVVVKDANINGDYKEFRSSMPGAKPLGEPPYGDGKPAVVPVSETAPDAKARSSS
ncbi:MSHA biogenesis protein MshL [Oxalobacteraceae bacterium GrIS 2.11]